MASNRSKASDGRQWQSHDSKNNRRRNGNNRRNPSSPRHHQNQHKPRADRGTIHLTQNLQRLVSSGEPSALQEADNKIRHHLRHWSNNTTAHFRPNEFTFGVLLAAYCKARHLPGAAVKAEQLLQLMISEYERQEEEEASSGGRHKVWLIPSTYCVSAAVSAWSKNSNMVLGKGDVDAIHRATAAIQKMEELHSKYGRMETKPNESVYNALLAVIAFVNNGKGAGRELSVEQRQRNAEYAESIVKDMEERAARGDASVQPSQRTFGSLIQVWAGAASLSNPRASYRVEQILRYMENVYESTGNERMRPNFYCYTNAIQGVARSQQPDAPRKAMDIVERMEYLSDSGKNTEAWPNAYAYCAVLNALAKSRSSGRGVDSSLSGKEVGDMADQLLDRMKCRNVPIDRAAANAAINAWARSGDPRALQRAEAIVAEMESSTYARGAPDTSTWNSLMNLYTKSGDKNAPEKTQSILNKLEKEYLDGTSSHRPQVLSYSAVLQAWAKSGRPEAPKEAEKVIVGMSQTKNGSDGKTLTMQPTSICYDALIETYARSDDPSASQKIDNILKFMEDRAANGETALVPTTRTFQAAIVGLSRRSAEQEKEENAAKAEQLLRRMIDLHRSGSHTIRPNNYVYSAVISAYASLNSSEGAAKAYELLREMLSTFNETGDKAIRPNQITWAAVIHAFANSNEAGSAETARSLLRKMTELSKLAAYAGVAPNSVVFNSVMQAYSNSLDIDAPEAAEKAEGILSEMKELAQAGDDKARPDAFSYATAMSAYARAGNPRRAEELLSEMKNDATLKLSVVPYTSVVQAYANSSMNTDTAVAVGRVKALLQEMWELSSAGDVGSKPNGGTCTAALQVYRRGFDDDENVERAEALLKRMIAEYESGDKSFKPGEKAFAAVLDGLREAGNDEAIKRIEQLQKQVGMVAII